jgi:transposase
MNVFVGVDWGSREHAACAVDGTGKVIAERTFAHTPAALQELSGWVVEHGGEGASVSIEVPRGPVVETLIDRGLKVFAINPKQLDRFRDRFGPSGAKDDRRDARVLADSLRTDARAFREVIPSADWLIELRELSRMREELVRERVALANGIREQLGRYFPQMLEVIEDVDASWSMALLAVAPTPVAARALPRAKLEKIMAPVRRITVDEARTMLRGPGFKVAAGTATAASRHMQMLLRRLVVIVQELRDCDGRVDAIFTELTGAEDEAGDLGQKSEQRDVVVLLSLPGVGRTILATLLAEAWEALRARNYHALRMLSGVAPVTIRSGKQLSVVRRLSRNPRLEDAVYHWARCATMFDPKSRAKYTALRARGHSHGRALRGLADRLLRVACAMLQSQETFREQVA